MRIFAVCCGLLAAFFITACDWEPSNTKSFDYGLQGTWVSNDPDIYSGTLIIGYDRITITGYTEGQTPTEGNDNRRPFKGFTKGIPLKGYSEEGKIFIEDGGFMQEGIHYTYWEDTLPPDYKVIKVLRFIFGGRVEILQNQ